MTDTLKSTDAGFIGTSVSTILTRGASNDLVVKQIRLTNQDTSNIVTRVWIAPNDGGAVRTVADDDQYEVSLSVPLGDSVWFPVNQRLESQNDTVQVKAATASKVSVVVSYIEETA